jgi:hypothetical protein
MSPKEYIKIVIAKQICSFFKDITKTFRVLRDSTVLLKM